MKQWKLATVMLIVSSLATLVCFSAAAQVWNYIYPRAIFLNSAYFFALASIILFLTVLFLDDLSDWVRNLGSAWLKYGLSYSFSLILAMMMVLALYMSAAGAYTLANLSKCSFSNLDSICTKSRTDISDAELKAMKKTFVYYLSFGDNPNIISELLVKNFKLD